MGKNLLELGSSKLEVVRNTQSIRARRKTERESAETKKGKF